MHLKEFLTASSLARLAAGAKKVTDAQIRADAELFDRVEKLSDEIADAAEKALREKIASRQSDLDRARSIQEAAEQPPADPNAPKS